MEGVNLALLSLHVQKLQPPCLPLLLYLPLPLRTKPRPLSAPNTHTYKMQHNLNVIGGLFLPSTVRRSHSWRKWRVYYTMSWETTCRYSAPDYRATGKLSGHSSSLPLTSRTRPASRKTSALMFGSSSSSSSSSLTSSSGTHWSVSGCRHTRSTCEIYSCEINVRTFAGCRWELQPVDHQIPGVTVDGNDSEAAKSWDARWVETRQHRSGTLQVAGDSSLSPVTRTSAHAHISEHFSEPGLTYQLSPSSHPLPTSTRAVRGPRRQPAPTLRPCAVYVIGAVHHRGWGLGRGKGGLPHDTRDQHRCPRAFRTDRVWGPPSGWVRKYWYRVWRSFGGDWCDVQSRSVVKLAK